MSRGINQKFKLYYLKEIMLRKTDETHALTMPQILEALETAGATAERKVYTPILKTSTNWELKLTKSRKASTRTIV